MKCPNCGHEPKALGLTAKQSKLLNFIREYRSHVGVSPSFEEMRDAMGLESKSGIHRMVVALERRGHITRRSNLPRSIEILS